MLGLYVLIYGRPFPAARKSDFTFSLDIQEKVWYNKTIIHDGIGKELVALEAVKQTINSNLLSGVIPLPKNFQNKNVEIIVFLSEENAAMPKFTMDEINEMLKGSITESLIGSVPQSNMALEDYRAERLKKYENIDWYEITRNPKDFAGSRIEVISPEEFLDQITSCE